ncbi:MAG: adenosylmethionine decarboxylase [Alphaproteobacteria bacterium]|nr:MAG: adenosylmethionine decarboxylase [Alphaproteobacteria bacterium]
MSNANLFRLGIGLEPGAQEEEDRGRAAATEATTITEANAAANPLRIVAGRDLSDPAREDHFVRRDGKLFAGTHLIIELVGGEGLDDPERIERAFRDCVDAAGATLLHIHTHKFTPQGVSGVAVLAESHISVHTWPEIGYGAFDVFMCGDADPWAAVPVLERAFDAREVRVTELLRGEDVVPAALGAA